MASNQDDPQPTIKLQKLPFLDKIERRHMPPDWTTFDQLCKIDDGASGKFLLGPVTDTECKKLQ